MGHKASARLIKVSRRRVSTPGDLASSLANAEPGAKSAKSSHAASSQADALGRIDHPILMIYVISAPRPEQPTEDLELAPVPAHTTLITVAVAFPGMSPEDINAIARQGKKYRVNTVWWRNVNGYVDDEGDDTPDAEGDL